MKTTVFDNAWQTIRNALRFLLREVLADSRNLVIGHSSRPSPGYVHAGFHCHGNWEWFIPLQGMLCFQAAGKPERKIKRGRMLLVPPECLHRSLPDLPQPSALQILAVNLPSAEDPTGCIFMGRPWNGIRLPLSAEKLNIWAGLLGESPTAMAARADQAFSAGEWGRERACSLLRFIVSALGEAAESGGPKNEPPTERNVRMALACLHQRHHQKELSLSMVAAEVGLSPTYLASLFKRITGKSVHQTLIDIRLNRATALLHDGRYSIKEVAALTGWNHPLYFSAAFRKRYGQPPSSARRKSRL